MTPSLEGWSSKAKEAPSHHDVRLAPLDTNPVFQSLGEKYLNFKVPKLRSKKWNHFLSKVNKLANLLNTVSFWLALKKLSVLWLSSLLLIFLLLSQTLSSFILPTYVYTLFQKQANSIYQCLVSYNCFQTKRLQFESPSNSSRTLSSVLLQTKGVVLWAKLQILMSCKKKKGNLNKYK